MRDTIRIILDTDIGSDVDDAGALGLLHILTRDTGAQILAVTNCTSNPYGNGAIDTINRAFGKTGIPVGICNREGFMWSPQSEIYNRTLCLEYENRFQYRQDAPPALQVIKTALADAPNHSVTMVAIGSLNNLAELIEADSGRPLIEEKVKLLVAMAGSFTHIEYNVKTDILAAQTVFSHWPTPIVVTPFSTGEQIITGMNFQTMRADHPVRTAYRLFNRGREGIGRSSWDLTAVWYAVMGPEPFFGLTEAYSVRIADDGRMVYMPAIGGNVHFLVNTMEPEAIGREIDCYWTN